MADTLLNRRMTSLDASFLYLERPNALLHVAAIYTFAKRLHYEGLLRYVAERLPLIPRYTQRAVFVPLNVAHPTWEADPEFNIRHHVKQHRLTEGHDDVALAQMCERLFAQPLDRDKPLWEMHLIDGYGSGCALFAKTHHAMIDGISGVQITNVLMDATPIAARAAAPPPAPAASEGQGIPNPLSRLFSGIAHTVRSEIDLVRAAAELVREPSRAVREVRETVEAAASLLRTVLSGVPPMPFNGPISDRRALSWVRFSLNEFKAIKNRLGGTVNDVVLTVITGGLRQYLRSRGVRTERTELKTMVPVSVRTEHEHLRLGNRVSMMVAPLPIGIVDPVERLRQICHATELLKSGGQAGQMERIVALTDLLPPLLQRPLARLASVTPVNTICTNVPGPRETRYLLGEPVQMIVPVVPLAVGIGLGFAIMSYADQITIGVNADAERVPDVEKLVAALQRSFDELWAATGLDHIETVGMNGTRRRRPPRTKVPLHESRATSKLYVQH